MGRVVTTIARSAIATALLTGVVPLPASAQTLNDALAGRAQAAGQSGSRLLVEAQEIIYDNDRNTVTLSGDVELSYQGRTLQADRVVYNRSTGRVFAEGNARLTEAGGAVITGSRFELTDDFKTGFIDSLRVEQPTVDQGRPVTARFSAPRAERIEGEQTIFERGTYTACEPCKKDPQRPPLWQVKAARIIHNNSERTIYYENATLELAGIPVAYLPYFWTPDPTVKRKTGFLTPRYVASTALGYGAQIPFFWAIAPNYDLTVQPTFLSRQGVLGEVEWRHRLLTGSYNIRAAGILQRDSSAFLPTPFGAGDRELRGSIETVGRFHINERWTYGWDVALLSDKWFLNNYRVRSESIATTYIRESISTAYLQGQGDRSWFDVRGYYFKGLSTHDWQKQLPVVHPVLDYEKRFNGPQPLGGEVAVEVNLTSLTREAAQFQSLSTANRAYLFPGTPYYGLYETCIVFQRGVCILRGLPGTNTRLSTQVSWRREFIDAAGQVWTPFAFARLDGFGYMPKTASYAENHQINNFVSGDNDFAGRAMPGIGIEYRYPFVADAGSAGVHTIEPIAQVIARPSETRIGRLPNEDAQSLVFEDTNIFEWNKFSGYDRIEGGVRANVGARYVMQAAGGMKADALIGQSFHLAGVNSFEPGDLVNTGRDSGLESRRSDYVSRLGFSPNRNISLFARGRFDEADLGMRRIEVGGAASFAPWAPVSASVIYAHYDAQPEIGFTRRREGVSTQASWNITPNWSVSGSVTFDLDRYLEARDTFITAYNNFLANPGSPQPLYVRDPHAVSSIGLSAAYADECTTFGVTYSMTPREGLGTKESVQTVLLRLELRTLGAVNLSQNVNNTTTQDGVATR